MSDIDEEDRPIFTAVSSSARQLYLLLRCISFAEKALVTISEEGLRFSVEEASVLEGFAFLDKSLFSSYQFHGPPTRARTPHSQHSDTTQDSNDDTSSNPTFQISLHSLLETLQIFGLTDPNNSRPWQRDTYTSTALNTPVLGMNNLCRIGYHSYGSPLTIMITEASIRTTCDLTTYEPPFTTDIPFDRQSLAVKIIMRASWLFDAVNELASASPENLTLVARISKGKPYFALSASGPLGSAHVEFNDNYNNQPASALQSTNQTSNTPDTQTMPSLLETFQLASNPTALRYTYKFSLIQKAARAMAVATKVSVRGDTQGVLSLQFMIEVEPGKVSFVDFHFVPLAEGEEDEGDDTVLNREEGSGSEREEDEDGDDE